MIVDDHASRLASIRRRAFNDTTRAMMRDGIQLTHEEADELGEEALDWLRNRLRLDVRISEDGITASPRR